jgi:hypothetical protein
VPGDSESGAIYFLDRETQMFSLAVFDEAADDSLSTAEFEQLVNEYDLLATPKVPDGFLVHKRSAMSKIMSQTLSNRSPPYDEHRHSAG